MKVEIISIGEELLNGKIQNTNAGFMAAKLSDAGFYVRKISAVGDNVEEIVESLEKAWKNDIIITTGGLGPTNDDLTQESVCEFFNVETVFNEAAFENIKSIYKKKNLPLPECNKKQAYIPKGSSILTNPIGTAPGIYIEKDSHHLFVMPGVPYEMEKMFCEMVLPKLINVFKPAPKLIYKFRTSGLTESLVFKKLDRMQWAPKSMNSSFLCSPRGIDVEVQFPSCTGNNQIESAKQRIIDSIGDFTYSYSIENMEDVIAKLLHKQKKTLATAESCTGGSVASILTDVSGSSNFFKERIVAYSNKAKVKLLGVSSSTLERFGAVSAECAKEMAVGVRLNAQTDIGLATTGIAGPTGGTPLKPLGLVYIAYSDSKNCEVQKLSFINGRLVHKERTTHAVLNLLWKHLMKGN